MPKEWIISEEDLGCDGAYLSYDEVVRCKDCAYWGNKVMLKDGTRGDCLNFFGYMTTTDFFCKWGEKRKEGGQNA